MGQVYVRTAIGLAMAALLAGRADGQTLTASVRGQVRDAQQGPVRNATVTAVTPCTPYRLHREDLGVAMDTQPAIRTVLEQESLRRTTAHDAS